MAGKSSKADVEILDQAAGGKNFFEVGFHDFGEALLLHALFRKLRVGHQDAAHHQDARGNGGKILVEHGELFARANGFDQEGFEFLASAFRFSEREQALWRLG